ncbi:MAG: oxidoreductase [Bacteroidales bacterium]
MKKPIQTAIVGFGLSGQAFHTPFLHVHEGFEIKKVLERNKTESKKIYPNVTIVKDLKEIINDKNIDLVVIATPNIYHYQQANQCLEAGKHVVIEKPFMPTSAECDEIIGLANSKNLNIFVYQNRRWDGDFLTIKKILKTGILAEIQYYEAHFDRYSPERKRAAWRDEQLPGSGILFDLGPHMIDQVLCLFGIPHSIKADIQSQRENSPVDDYFKISFSYPTKEVILTAGMLVEEHDLRYIIHGANGSFIKYGIDPQEDALRKGELPGGENWGKENPVKYGLITLDGESEDFDGVIETVPGNYMEFYNNVYKVFSGEEEQEVKPVEARNVIRLIELAFKSAKQQKAIKVDLEQSIIK